ncbi:MAG: hypothetical protein OXS33_11200 [bacterium]|nr:hypothetical protein [bacterium]
MDAGIEALLKQLDGAIQSGGDIRTRNMEEIGRLAGGEPFDQT